MKRLYFVALAFCCLSVTAQTITIPDASMKQRLVIASQFNTIAKTKAASILKLTPTAILKFR